MHAPRCNPALDTTNQIGYTLAHVPTWQVERAAGAAWVPKARVTPMRAPTLRIRGRLAVCHEPASCPCNRGRWRNKATRPCCRRHGWEEDRHKHGAARAHRDDAVPFAPWPNGGGREERYRQTPGLVPGSGEPETARPTSRRGPASPVPHEATRSRCPYRRVGISMHGPPTGYGHRTHRPLPWRRSEFVCPGVHGTAGLFARAAHRASATPPRQAEAACLPPASQKLTLTRP